MTIIVRSRDSLLTTSSGYTNYRGILNLVIILLVLSNARAALENVIKYGILVDPLSWLLFLGEGSKHWPALLIVLSLSLNILLSLAIEKVLAKLGTDFLTNKGPVSATRATLTMAANATLFLNLAACLLLPPVIIYSNDTHPISTSGSLMIVSIVFLKLVSYHMMNFWCRDLQRPQDQQARTTKSFLRSYVPPAIDFGTVLTGQGQCSGPERSCSNGGISSKPVGENGELRKRAPGKTPEAGHSEGDKPNDASLASKGEHQSQVREVALRTLSRYPHNLNLRDLRDFMVYPTLNYELEFAKTVRIRKRFLIKRIVELIILSQLDMALIQQWIVPTVSNSVLPFRQMQFSHMLERLLKLAIPNHVIWLIWFYLFFHSLLNIIAELTRFADREFYRDWWNSESVYYFWSNWNIPVHKWCARHLYVPSMALGLTKCQASTAVFFVSAFFHEYLVSVPLKMFRMWAFTGMLIQLPWARFVSSYFNNNFANVAVWVSLIIGQPLCILMYYHDYYVINHVKSLPSR